MANEQLRLLKIAHRIERAYICSLSDKIPKEIYKLIDNRFTKCILGSVYIKRIFARDYCNRQDPNFKSIFGILEMLNNKNIFSENNVEISYYYTSKDSPNTSTILTMSFEDLNDIFETLDELMAYENMKRILY